MIIISVLQKALISAGYLSNQVVEDYVFSDVLSSNPTDRIAKLAAFTQSPPSYRTAAIAAVEGTDETAAELVQRYRALGAPLLFVYDQEKVSIWEVRARDSSRRLAQVTSAQLEAVFQEHADEWSPLSIHRAKSIGTLDKSCQLDFVDVGLMPAIEQEIHAKLDISIEVATSEAIKFAERLDREVDTRRVFRTVFRLLAAKVLLDRGHEAARDWDVGDLGSVWMESPNITAFPGLPRSARAWGAPCSSELGLSFNRRSTFAISLRMISHLSTKTRSFLPKPASSSVRGPPQ